MTTGEDVHVTLASDGTYDVMLTHPDGWDVERLADTLAAFCKIPRFDALQAIQEKWGLVAEGIGAQVAQALCRHLEQNGFAATCVPHGSLAQLRDGTRVVQAEVGEDGWRWVAPVGTVITVPWKSLSLIAAAAFEHVTTTMVKGAKEPDTVKMVASIGVTMLTGIPISMGRKKSPGDTKSVRSNVVHCLNLFADGLDTRLCLDAQNFNYACLKEKIEYSIGGNFKTLLHEIVGYAPQARMNRGARLLLANRPLHEMGYRSTADLDQECRWLLTLESRAPGAQAG